MPRCVLNENILDVTRNYLAANRIPHSRILRALLIEERNARYWYSLFGAATPKRGKLWKVDIEREALPENVIDSGNVFCLLIDPETLECAPFYTM